MTKAEILAELNAVKTILEDLHWEAEQLLKGYGPQAIQLAMEAMCHAIDLVGVAEEGITTPGHDG